MKEWYNDFMSKLHIKEVIVVEGKHDLEHLSKFVDADIIYSNGMHISNEFLDLCERLNKKQGIIIFTDPDGPGERIRKKIMARVGECKHASLHVAQSKKKQKVGIEHADKEDIIESLKKSATLGDSLNSLSSAQFIELGLSGGKESKFKRDLLSEAFKFPVSNAKTCLKYLNMLGIDYESCIKVLEGENL